MRKLILIISALLLSNAKQSMAQPDRLESLETFYMTDWLIDLPNKIQIFETLDSIPESTRYSVLHRIENHNYDLECWTEQWNSLESPTKVKGKISLKFKPGLLEVRIGDFKKGTYYIDGNQLKLEQK